ncbi:Adaptive-response sensory-kinase SasA [Achromobacter deleyi]|uniref:histidine kinase n=1 Tax=Achromobacter deleyi TaxID=1353891 RepID=A0A6S6ZQR4_9BURK|nr:CHASE2 domain-containing protein [Achromobacter deleyi]CAB3680649.1 Adaptive-response sensory-kinase SasA [Achromobacter deleyi]CAB3831755.1 Adaptive-response sensory-kinase SasA [Achromobacter deleyi]CAB3862938.1 Adaptive-response sensory-kinase SasA [Achromobacter deleyi]
MPDATDPIDRTSRSGLWLTVVLALLAALLGSFNGLGRIDQILYDRAVALTGRDMSPDILIVAIDDTSIEALGRWPWRRAVHAALLDRLQGARAVGLDLIFAEPDTVHPGDDAILADSIRRNGHTVLPVVLDRLVYPSSISTPIPILAQAAAGSGFINASMDADGVLRSAVLTVGFAGEHWRHFALSMLDVGGQAALSDNLLRRARPDGSILIPYAGPAAHTRAVSYLSVLRGDVPPEQLRGKYVLVGAWATGLGDAYTTPVSHEVSGMPGVEIIANLLQAANDDIAFQPPAPWLNALFSALPVLLACLALWRLSPNQALLVNIGLLALVLISSLLLLGHSYLWFAPTAALVGVALCYPLWSWRSQEAALRYMDTELRRLQREYPPVLNEARAQFNGPTASLESRVGELRRALARVRNLRRFLADGLDGMPDATLVFDQEGRMQFRNQAAVMYFQRLGMRPPRVGHPATHLLEKTISDDSTRQRVAQVLSGQGPASDQSPWSADLEVRDRAGRDLILKCAPIHTAEGNFAGTVATLTDISGIRHAERQREETLRFISHDMRAPQSSILALVEMTQENGVAPGKDETLTRIAALANRTLHLVDDFVHLTRAESMAINAVELDLGSLLQDGVDEFWASAHKRGIELVVRTPLPAAYVRGDQTLLMRALCNLIDNAIKYSPAQTRIECGIDAAPGYWRASVRDHGQGIAPQDLARLFEPFARVGVDTKADVGGAGLGLAFVRTVAQRHGGEVEVTSELGTGSVFTLQLPMAPDEARAD